MTVFLQLLDFIYEYMIEDDSTDFDQDRSLNYAHNIRGEIKILRPKSPGQTIRMRK